MRYATLFSGIGGPEIAADSLGWQSVFACDNNPFSKQVLTYHFPHLKFYDDVTTTDFHIYRNRIDCLIGGFPCQPFSNAGKRLGKEDPRHLWPHFMRAIREIRPSWVVGENVYGLVNWSDGLVLNEIKADLETEGYQVQSYVYPACSTGAPHKRDRIFIVAYCNRKHRGRERKGHEKQTGDTFRKPIKNNGEHGPFTYSRSNNDTPQRSGAETKGCRGFVKKQGEWKFQAQRLNRSFRFSRAFTYSNGAKPANHQGKDRGPASPLWRHKTRHVFREFRGIGDATNAKSWRYGRLCNQGKKTGPRKGNKPFRGICRFPYRYATNATGRGGFQDNRKGEPRQFNQESALPNWQNFPTQPPVCSGNDGLSGQLDGITFSKWRNETIKAYGNAIVPAQILPILKSINDYERLQS